MSRLRHRSLPAVVVAALFVITACNPPSNEPDAYDDTTKANFVQGCTGIVTEGTALDASTSSLEGGAGADPQTCECQYNYFVDNVPFDSEAAEQQGEGPDAPNFVELNQQLEDDPNSMPDDIKNGLQAACLDGNSVGTTQGPGESQSGTTVAPSDTAAETTTTTTQ